MAITSREVELIVRGMDVDNLDKMSFIQNMQKAPGGVWETRAGFGQVTQFDTTLAFGDITYQAHCGSKLIKTDFGHEQIISVFKISTFTGNLYGGALERKVGNYGSFFLCVIYDVTTDEIWEELLVKKTNEDVSSLNEYTHGAYETNRDNTHVSYVAATETNPEFFFEEINDVLFFGNKFAGTFAYIPATFSTNSKKHFNSVDRQNWISGVSETCLIEKIVPVDGIFTDAFAYLNSSEFPNASDICATIDNRIVYASDRILWFADRGRPNSIIADNFLTIPSENLISTITEFNGNIIIFTSSEMFLYQPSSGETATGGRLTKVSETIGCVSPNAIAVIEGLLVWVSRFGVHATSSGLDVKEISEKAIKSFWTDYVSNPLTNFFQQNGFANSATNTQPAIQHHFQSGKITIAHDVKNSQILVCIPAQNIVLVFSLLEGGGWSLWNFESMAQVQNTVKASNKIQNPWLVTGETDVFLVGSAENVLIDDGTVTNGYASEDVNVDSFYLLRLGKGGALDKSIGNKAEDDRNISGKYYNIKKGGYPRLSGSNAIYIDPWIKVEQNFKFPNSPTTQTGSANSYLLPISIVPTDNPAIERLSIQFMFDNTNWIPIFRAQTGTSTLNVILPSERIESMRGYSTGSQVSASSEVRLYAGETASRNGNEIRIHWSGSANDADDANIGSGPYGPKMNLNLNQKNPLLYIPFEYVGGTSKNVTSMGITGTMGRWWVQVSPSTQNFQEADFFVWQQAQWSSRSLASDERAQAVDWCYKTPQAGIKDQVNLKARTLFVKMQSFGKATTRTVANGSIYGLFNTLVGSDWKEWSAQTVDYASGSLTGSLGLFVDKSTIRSRQRDFAGNLNEMIFNLSASWGNVENASSGSFLIGDPEFDTIAISDSTRGEHFSWMIFGHLKNRAEHLAFDSVKADLRVAGGRRRRGR